MSKHLDLPKICESRRVTIRFKDVLVTAGYHWPIVDVLDKHDGSGDDAQMVQTKRREFNPFLYVYTVSNPSHKEENMSVCRTGGKNKEYARTGANNVLLDYSEEILEKLHATIRGSGVRNHKQVRNRIDTLVKMGMLTANHVGASIYGESRLSNVDKFTVLDVDSLSSYRSEYQETEYDNRNTWQQHHPD